MKRDIRDILDGNTIPDDVPHWIVELQIEFDERNLTPLQAVKSAANQTKEGHCWQVIHVRSGLSWSVDIGREEVVELATGK
jgi:hypothetical protein